MKPLMSRKEDSGTLQDLGRASIQIVHDLKNQLNGLKLYATFLRKRLEKSERPDDEQETISKLISGLDRAANDLSTIVQYGREIELKKQPGFDLQKILRAICLESNLTPLFETDSMVLIGDFDPAKLTDALRWISVGAERHRSNVEGPGRIAVTINGETENGRSEAVIEWIRLTQWDHDPFHSFIGSDEIRMSLAAKIIEAHGGSAKQGENSLIVRLPLSDTALEPTQSG